MNRTAGICLRSRRAIPIDKVRDGRIIDIGLVSLLRADFYLGK